jgi:hypothetical protein
LLAIFVRGKVEPELLLALVAVQGDIYRRVLPPAR